MTAGELTISCCAPPPAPTVSFTVMTVAVPVVGEMVMCPVKLPFDKLVAVAVIVRIAGAVGVTRVLPLVIDDESQG